MSLPFPLEHNKVILRSKDAPACFSAIFTLKKNFRNALVSSLDEKRLLKLRQLLKERISSIEIRDENENGKVVPLESVPIRLKTVSRDNVFRRIRHEVLRMQKQRARMP